MLDSRPANVSSDGKGRGRNTADINVDLPFYYFFWGGAKMMLPLTLIHVSMMRDTNQCNILDFLCTSLTFPYGTRIKLSNLQI